MTLCGFLAAQDSSTMLKSSKHRSRILRYCLHETKAKDQWSIIALELLRMML